MRTVLLVLAILALTSAFGWWHRTRQGRVRTQSASADQVLDTATIGSALGEHATFVQLSSTVCAPCRATARVLGTLAETHAGVRHVELDAAEHLDLVRRLDVRRTPTTLVLDRTGVVVARLSGAVDPRQAADALATVATTAPSGGPA